MLVLSPATTALATAPAAATGPRSAEAPTATGELVAESPIQGTRAGRTIPDTVRVSGLIVGPESQMWIPEFGTPRSERLPDLWRLDLSATWLHPFWEENLTTVFLALTNVLNRENISGIRYNRDVSEAIPVRSSFERTVFVGASTSFTF